MASHGKGCKKNEKVAKVVKKGLQVRGGNNKLTQTEKLILEMLSEEYLTVKQITIRRRCTTQSIYKIIKQLRKKGAISRNFKRVAKTEGTMQPQPHKIRLHGQQWHIKILHKDTRHKNNIGKNIELDGNTVLLHTSAISIYSNVSFFGKTVETATLRSMRYWNRLFKRLESLINLILIKPKSHNITLVKAHYAEVDNEMAKEHEIKGIKFHARTTNDGKCWLEIDNSFNFHELETTHPKTSMDDMQKVVRQVNDWRDTDPPTNSELKDIITMIAQENKETAAGVNNIVKIIQILIPKEEVKGEVEIGKADYIG